MPNFTTLLIVQVRPVTNIFFFTQYSDPRGYKIELKLSNFLLLLRKGELEEVLYALYVSDFCLILYVNYRGKCPLLENVTPPRGGLQSSRALSDIFLRVIKIAGQSRILEFLKRVATRNFSKKIS